jgi:hypothetical protein
VDSIACSPPRARDPEPRCPAPPAPRRRRTPDGRHSESVGPWVPKKVPRGPPAPVGRVHFPERQRNSRATIGLSGLNAHIATDFPPAFSCLTQSFALVSSCQPGAVWPLPFCSRLLHLRHLSIPETGEDSRRQAAALPLGECPT